MTHYRGLRTELCPSCKRISLHRTLYVKIEFQRRSKWFRLFRVCSACDALNHVVRSTYNLESVPSEFPSPLVASIIDGLRGGPLDFDGLVQVLRWHRVGVRHVFKPDVAMAMGYLVRHRVVGERVDDLTERTLAELRARPSQGRHLGPCPAEGSRGIVRKSLVSLYAQHRIQAEAGKENPAGQLRISRVGALCIQCGYHHVDADSAFRP